MRKPRVTEDQKAQIVYLRELKHSHKKIGEMLGINEHTVQNVLRSKGLTDSVKYARMTDEEKALAEDLRAQGMSYKAIAKEVGKPYSSVRYYLLDGSPSRRESGRKLTKAQVELVNYAHAMSRAIYDPDNKNYTPRLPSRITSVPPRWKRSTCAKWGDCVIPRSYG